MACSMIDSPPSIRVVKLGGSLLELDDLEQRIENWISRQTPATTIWIVGGGELVEEIRRQDESCELNAEVVHWSCVEKMDDNALRLAAGFPEWKRFESVDSLDVEPSTRNWILSHLSWTRRHTSHLPKTWDVTSDSIAATLAHWIGARELVLLKSTDPPMDTDVETAVSRGFVDGYFLQAFNRRDLRARASGRYSVRVVNLRCNSLNETIWDK